MKIAIAGSGALGSGFGAKLFQAGYDVTLIDGYTSHVEAVKQHGLNITINGEAFELNIPGHSHLLGSGPVEIGELVDEGKENVIKVADLLNEAELNGVIS
ncbi:2-dehydropantoate 2-reductase N-terminal domain-containing protein, partial [Staphylococcus hominis]|uniref:2-dehydropantoate 2-reductase N-terminal domain-containing protein n=1 Tax=Staphylococcus hominis TaxID=1290 RepID=UPI00351D014D